MVVPRTWGLQGRTANRRSPCCSSRQFLVGWKAWTALLLLGFAGMLHPTEIIFLVRKDLIFPSDLGGDMDCMFIHLQNPKTHRFARRQRCRVDDPEIIAFCFSAFSSYHLDQRLYCGSAAQFRRQWDSVMKHLGIPCRQCDRGATPGSLRRSGATFFAQQRRMSLLLHGKVGGQGQKR